MDPEGAALNPHSETLDIDQRMAELLLIGLSELRDHGSILCFLFELKHLELYKLKKSSNQLADQNWSVHKKGLFS